MAYFLRWSKLTFIICCIIGLIGLCGKFTQNMFDSVGSVGKCNYHISLLMECSNETDHCSCTTNNCQADEFSGSNRTYVSDCFCTRANVEALCDNMDSFSRCIITGNSSCNASVVSWSVNDPVETELRCMNAPCQQWSQWTNCSSTCGGGLRQRTRQCAEFENGACALKQTSESAVCNTGPCPAWSPWSQWSACTVTCNGGHPGYRTRIRACPTPDSCGDSPAFEIDPHPCTSNITCPQWSQWGLWSRCSRTCGRGDRVRNRQCNFSAMDATCLGSGKQTEPCLDKACPLVTYWAGWSPCTATCAGGFKTRSRVTCPEGPPACPLESEQEKCNSQPCPQWSQWAPWLDCSRTCGGGQRVRRRKCPIDRGCVGRTMQLDKLRCNNFECPALISPLNATVSGV